MPFDKKTGRLIFLIGTLSSLVLFLALTVDTHRQIQVLTHADQLSDQVIAGKRVWEKYNCNDCHTILGFGGYYAPDMTRSYKRLGATGLRQTVTKPDLVFASSWRKMPQQNLSPEEVASLITFLQWVNNVDTHEWPPQDSEKMASSSARKLVGRVGMTPGAALVKEEGCLGCHRIGGVGSDVGPALDGVGSKYDPNTLAEYIRNPQKINPASAMPAQTQIQPPEANSIAEFLAGLK